MTLYKENDDGNRLIFEPEQFLVPPMEGFLRRVFGARWGLIIVSSPIGFDNSPVMDFLASWVLQQSFYSEFSTEKNDFYRLEKEEIKIRTIEEVIEDAHNSVDPEAEPVIENGVVQHVPRNPEIVFIHDLSGETVTAGVEAAMSGRLVVGGINAEGSFPALQEFRNMAGSDHLVAATLMGIVGINCVERLCPVCKLRMEYELNSEEVFLLGTEKKTITAFVPHGCDECDNTGFQGKILIQEGFELTGSIRSHILESMPPRQLRMAAKKEGLRTLLDATWDLAEAGETTLDEVSRIAEGTDPGKIENNL